MKAEGHAQWGTKRTCPSCHAKFYDLKRTPAVCPKCHAEFVEPPRLKSSGANGAKQSWRRSPVSGFSMGRGRNLPIPANDQDADDAPRAEAGEGVEDETEDNPIENGGAEPDNDADDDLPRDGAGED